MDRIELGRSRASCKSTVDEGAGQTWDLRFVWLFHFQEDAGLPHLVASDREAISL
ncbi:MAG: hypothetical protein ACYCTV_11195 [Leptospirales bacterium]